MELRQQEDESGAGRADGTADAGDGSGSDPESSLSDSDVFDVLRNSRRRAALPYLLDAEEPVTVRELTKHVAAEEYDTTVEDVSSDQHKRVYTGLYQCHLPRLDDFGVVEFDREAKTVRADEGASRVEPYLDTGGGSRVHVEPVVAVFVTAVVVAGVAGVGPLGPVPVGAWAGFTVVALLAAAARLVQ